MEILNISSTKKTPKVKFDTEGTLYIGGRSIHEQPENFYIKIINIIDETKEGKKLYVVFDFEYFNTAASKMITILLKKIDERDSQIEWIYECGDDDMEEAGEVYSSMVKTPFIFTEK